MGIIGCIFGKNPNLVDLDCLCNFFDIDPIGAPSHQLENRIVGGMPINITQTPWLVSLQNQGGLNHFCGGAIISDRWILTTRECIGTGAVYSVYVRAGATHKYEDGQLHRVEETIAHEYYNPYTGDYNYGLIKLKTKLEFSDAIKPIRLPNIDDKPVAAGTRCMVSGWGITLNDSETDVILRATNMPIIDEKTCKRRALITPRMICAGLEEGGVDG